MTLLNTLNYSYDKKRTYITNHFFNKLNKNILTDIDMSSILF